MNLEQIRKLKSSVAGNEEQGWKEFILDTSDVSKLLQIAEAAYTVVNRCDLQQELHWLDDLRRAFK